MSEELRMDLDDLLAGHWSSLPLSYGAMEASELGFLPDGRGWSSWFNVGALCVTRFGWTRPEPEVVELHMKWMVEGTPNEGASPTFASMEPAVQVDEVTRHHYIVKPVIPMPGGDALTAVSFEVPVEFCRQYARGLRRTRPTSCCRISSLTDRVR
jgi:hypothetical protein